MEGIMEGTIGAKPCAIAHSSRGPQNVGKPGRSGCARSFAGPGRNVRERGTLCTVRGILTGRCTRGLMRYNSPMNAVKIPVDEKWMAAVGVSPKELVEDDG